MDRVYQLNQGMRVVGCSRAILVVRFGVGDERDMVAYWLPGLQETREAIAKLNQRGKVLTGDNESVAAAVCKKVGIHVDELLEDVENLNDEQLKGVSEDLLF